MKGLKDAAGTEREILNEIRTLIMKMVTIVGEARVLDRNWTKILKPPSLNKSRTSLLRALTGETLTPLPINFLSL